MPLKIDYIEFQTRELTRSKAFFAAAFGWSHVDYGPGYASFAGAGIDGGYGQAEADALEPVLVVLKADDLVAAEQAVVAAGGEIVRPAFDFPGGAAFPFPRAGRQYAGGVERNLRPTG